MEDLVIKHVWIKQYKTISSHFGYISGIAFRNNQEVLLTGSYDGTVALTGLGTRTKGRVFKLNVPVKAIAFGEAENTILAFTDDKLVHIPSFRLNSSAASVSTRMAVRWSGD
jgi:WD40 repeat protein